MQNLKVFMLVRMMKMVVIRTSLRQRIIRAVLSLAFSAAGFAAVIVGYPHIVSFFVRSEAVDECIGNSNDDICLLYEQSNTDIQQKSEQAAEQVPSEPETSSEPEKEYPSVSTFAGKYLLTQNECQEKEDLSLFDRHSGKIYEETFGKGSGPQYIELSGGSQLRNCTDIPNSVVEEQITKGSDIRAELFTDEPQVLILHTHTTESYEPYEKDWFDERYTSRSFDPANGVVAVGEAISRQLAGAGISVIHDCRIHDAVYTGAYNKSLDTAEELLSHYPSIKVVLDIHRDAIEYTDGSRISAVTAINGRKAAQIMMICAADDGTYDVPGFYDNLRFACTLQQSIGRMFPTLARPILFQYCQYNQQVSPGAMLIEVGSHGNSIDEAVYSGELIGKALAAMLTEEAAVPVMASVPAYFFNRVK